MGDFEVTPNFFKLMGSIYFIFLMAVILLDRFKILIMPSSILFIESSLVCVIYPMIIIGLRTNTFSPFGLPILNNFFLLKLWRWRYKELEYVNTDSEKYRDYNNKYYSYRSYYFIASIVGFFPMMGGFIYLIYRGNPFIFAFGIFMQTIVLFPDVWDKIIPLNFKKWTGGTFLILLAIPSWILAFYLGNM